MILNQHFQSFLSDHTLGIGEGEFQNIENKDKKKKRERESLDQTDSFIDNFYKKFGLFFDELEWCKVKIGFNIEISKEYKLFFQRLYYPLNDTRLSLRLKQ